MPYGIRYNPELADKICELLASGQSLRTICAAPDMPERHSVRRWAIENSEFRQKYEQARLLWSDELFEQIAERASGACGVAEQAETAGLNPQAAVSALREEIRALMWVCAKLRPDKYGDRAQLELTGKDGTALIPSSASRIPQVMQFLSILLPETGNSELMALAQSMVERLGAAPALLGGEDAERA